MRVAVPVESIRCAAETAISDAAIFPEASVGAARQA
jgi:hypothetical protein